MKCNSKNSAIGKAYEVINKSDDTNNLAIHEGVHKGMYDCIVVQHDLTGKILFLGYWG